MAHWQRCGTGCSPAQAGRVKPVALPLGGYGSVTERGAQHQPTRCPPTSLRERCNRHALQCAMVASAACRLRGDEQLLHSPAMSAVAFLLTTTSRRGQAAFGVDKQPALCLLLQAGAPHHQARAALLSTFPPSHLPNLLRAQSGREQHSHRSVACRASHAAVRRRTRPGDGCASRPEPHPGQARIDGAHQCSGGASPLVPGPVSCVGNALFI